MGNFLRIAFWQRIHPPPPTQPTQPTSPPPPTVLPSAVTTSLVSVDARLARNLRKLPVTLLNLVFSWSASPQPPLLRNDLLSFHSTRAMMIVRYFHFHRLIQLEEEENAELFWITNDLESYMNDDVALGSHYSPKFYNTWSRNPFLKSQSMMRKYTKSLFNYHANRRLSEEESIRRVTKHLNLCVGILTPDEREDFLDKQTALFDSAIGEADAIANM